MSQAMWPSLLRHVKMSEAIWSILLRHVTMSQAIWLVNSIKKCKDVSGDLANLQRNTRMGQASWPL
eukprot:7580162-Pyramimonas_sp.AAC.1